MSRPVTPKVAKLLQEGTQLMQAGVFLEAGRAFERAAQQMPDLADAHCFRADALMRAGKLEQALSSVVRAIRLRPGWGEALMLRGNIEALLERFAAAEASFRDALRLLGPTAALQKNLGNVLLEQERFAEALEAYEQALRQADLLELQLKRMQVLYRLRRMEEAERAARQVLDRVPDSLEALELLANVYAGSHRFEELQALCERALALAPEAAGFRLRRGTALWGCGRFDEALEEYRHVAGVTRGSDKELHYEANANEALGLLLLGRLREGWERYLFRADREALRENYPLLAADPAAIRTSARALKIRVHSEQGIGDELFFLRFVPWLRAQGHVLSYRTYPKLVELLRHRGELFAEVGRKDQQDRFECDVELQTSDLALASGESFAPPLSLHADPTWQRAFAERLRAFGPPPYVGVTWRAGLIGEEQKNWKSAFWEKHIPVEEFGHALRPLCASIVILQRKPAEQDIGAFCRGLGRQAIDMSDVNEDLHQALALLSLLDEYVGVSNTNMHLMAGLSGKARVLMQSSPEWRWGLHGDESAWFPGFRIYRQAKNRSWAEPLSQLARDLSEALARTR